MINSDEELALEYLLSPEFEMTNSGGKPLTDGWIEVYIHGTRDKYYCYSDWAGTLHPFQIPLDSLGSNVVLADPNNAYDVYFYNKYGSLIMSRYNVKCQGSGSGGAAPYIGDRLEYGQYTASNVLDVATLNRTQGNIATTSDGKIKLKEDMSYHITVRGSYVIADPLNTETTLNFIEPTTLNRIKINVDNTITDPQYFELSYDLFKLQYDTDYAIAFDSNNGKVDQLTVEVHSLSNLNTTLTGGQLFEQGWGILIEDNVISVDPTIFNDYVTWNDLGSAVSSVHTEITNETLELVSSVSSILQNEIDNIQEGVQPDWEQDDDTQPDYIKNKPDLSVYATHDEVIEVVTAVSTVLQNEIDNIPEQVNADWEATSGKAEILNKPDLDIYATREEVASVTGDLIEIVSSVSSTLENEIDNTRTEIVNMVCAVSSTLETEIDNTSTEIINTVCAVSSVLQDEIDNIPEQVQSNWEETDTDSPAYIQNKPDLDIYATHEEVNAVTGDLVNIVSSVSSVLQTNIEEGDTNVLSVVSAVSSVLQNEIDNIPEQVQSDWEQNDDTQKDYIKNKPDLDIYATHDEVSGVSSVLVELINDVSAAVPEAQVQSDWAETDNTKKSYIQNKPDLDIYATIETVTSVSSVLQNEIDNIPEQVQSDWTETDTADPAYILHKPEVQDIYAGQNITLTETASGLEISSYGTDTSAVSAIAEAYMEIVTGMIPEAQVQSDWTESDTTDPSYIQNKPTPKTLVAGDGILITDTVTGVEISAAVTGIEGYVTQQEFIEVVSAVTGTGDYGQFYCNTASGACVMGKIKGTIDVTNDGKIELEKGKSYHMSVRGCYKQSTASNTEDTIGFIEYVTNNTIQINVDRTTTQAQYFDLGFDVYNLSNDVDYYVFFTGVSNSGVVQDVFVDVHTILGGGGGNGGGGGGAEYNQGWGIVITNNSISVNPNIIPDISNLATKDEVSLAIATATGAQINPNWNESSPLSKAYIQNKPSEMYLMGGQNVEINIVGASAIISASVSGGGGGTTYTAGDYIDITNDTISVTGLDNSNIFWATYNVTTHADVLAAYNAGKRIFLVDGSYVVPLSGKDNYNYFTFIYYSNVGGAEGPYVYRVTVDPNYGWGRYYASMQANWNQTNIYSPDYIRNKPDLSTYATVASVTAVAASIPEIELNGDSQVTAIDGHALAGGGGTQVQSDWTESDTSDPSYIQNKPEEQMLIAGNNVEITIDGASAIISAQGGGGGATYSAGQNISISNQNVIAVTGLAQADWSSVSGASQILNKPTEKNLVAGANVTITESGDDVVVQTTEIASGLQLVAGAGITLTVSGSYLVIGLA